MICVQVNFLAFQGEVTLLHELNRESRAIYTLTITAADNDNIATQEIEPRREDTTVSVIVTDINDCSPQFGALKFTKMIQETAPVDEVFITYTAQDDDQGLSAELRYSFNETLSNGTDIFHINAVTGGISPKKRLTDHIGCYKLYLVAEDRGTPSLHGTAELKLCVEDLNNNPPKITKPASNNATYLIQEVSQILLPQ